MEEVLPQQTETVELPSAPIALAERISAIDTLRGFALLGILLMNIVPFGMYASAYDNPTVTGGATGANLIVWTVLHILAEGKMRCLFSLVFGASVILLTSRLDKTGEGADIYYRRTIWLMLFGIAHGFLLWLGDILYPYALCGLLLYPFRKMSAKGLLILSAVLVVLTAAAAIGMGFDQRSMLDKGEQAVKAAAAGKKLTPEQEEAKTRYEAWRKHARPTPEQLAKDAAEWRGTPLQVIKARAKVVGKFNSLPYYHPLNLDIWSMMFLGIGLMKMGVLSAAKSTRFYLVMTLIGYAVGLPVNSYTAWVIIRSNFDPAVHAFANSSYDVGRLSIALGHLGLIMWFCKTGALRSLMSNLGAIGQMAFSNYVMQSVICSFFFTGYGLKMYGRLERYQLYYVVGAIWILQMIVSPIWLRRYRFGPLEWAWRSLTYWKKQPMRLAAPEMSISPTP